jgi:hypothetical protein
VFDVDQPPQGDERSREHSTDGVSLFPGQRQYGAHRDGDVSGDPRRPRVIVAIHLDPPAAAAFATEAPLEPPQHVHHPDVPVGRVVMALDRTLDAHPVAGLGPGVLNDRDQARQVREVHQQVEDGVARSLKHDRLLAFSHEVASQPSNR